MSASSFGELAADTVPIPIPSCLESESDDGAEPSPDRVPAIPAASVSAIPAASIPAAAEPCGEQREHAHPESLIETAPVDLHEALAELLPELTGYFLRRLADRDDAADAAGDTLLVLLGKGERLPTTAEGLRQYAYGVARKVLSRARRGRVRRTELSERLRAEIHEQAPAPPDPDPELRAAIARLPERDRELLLLVAWEGLGVAEAGAILGLSAAASRKRYSRLRERLRVELG
ncbi:MAG: sigma-70 family RNA polymerase sigma factor [Leucobacter sp.]